MTDIISSALNLDDKDNWKTDPVVFNALNNEFDFSLDAACNKDNYYCYFRLTNEEDALCHDWSAVLCRAKSKSVFINPPYSRGSIKRYMGKCIEQKKKGLTCVMLVPNAIEAKWLPIQEISEIRVITGGRLSFYHPNTNKKVSGNTKGSMLVIFRPTKMPCFINMIDRDEFLSLGSRI